MGPAHSTVVNHTLKKLCIITFPHSDILYYTYNAMYIVEPGQSIKAEATPDALGLKVGLIYDVNPDTKELYYVRFSCKNDSVLNISELQEDDVSWYGDNIDGYSNGKIRETTRIPFEMALSAVRNQPISENTVYSAYAQPDSNAASNGLPPALEVKMADLKPETTAAARLPSGSTRAQPNVSNVPKPSQYSVPIPATTVTETAQEKWEQRLKQLKEISGNAEERLARTKAEQTVKARHAHEAAIARQELEREEARREKLRLEEETRRKEEERMQQFEEERQAEKTRILEEERKRKELQHKTAVEEEDEDEESEDYNKKKKGKKPIGKNSPNKKGKKKHEDDDSENEIDKDEDDEDEDDDREESDDDSNKKRKKPKKKGKGKKSAEQVDQGCSCTIM